jgi:hypothetical protein
MQEPKSVFVRRVPYLLRFISLNKNGDNRVIIYVCTIDSTVLINTTTVYLIRKNNIINF